MNNLILINVLQMPDISVELMQLTLKLLQQHATEVSAELHEGAVEVIPSAQNPDFFIIKTTTSKEEWKKYEAGKRPTLRAWFKKNLLDPGYVRVEQILEINL